MCRKVSRNARSVTGVWLNSFTNSQSVYRAGVLPSRYFPECNNAHSFHIHIYPRYRSKLGRIKSDFIKCVGSMKFNSCFYRYVESMIVYTCTATNSISNKVHRNCESQNILLASKIFRPVEDHPQRDLFRY